MADEQLMKAIDYTFIAEPYLTAALTHPSYAAEHADVAEHNQRLEFLGDAVLQIIVTDILYQRYPTLPEGQLTKLRAILTRRPTLADFGRQIGLGQHLRLGHGERLSGGADRQSTLCDGFEALLGAMYLDANRQIAAVHRLVTRLIDESYPELLGLLEADNPKGALQERLQKALHLKPEYRVISETGPDHAKEFTMGLYVGSRCLGEGVGSKRQIAEQRAAQTVLKAIEDGEIELESL